MKNLAPAFIVITIIGCLMLAGFFIVQKNQAQAPPTISGKFYKLDIVAQVGADNLTSINSDTTLNDKGTIAFSGRSSDIVSPNVQKIFARDVTGPLRGVTNPTVPENRRQVRSLQINNSSQIISKIETTLNVHEVRRWDGNAVETSVLVANGAGQIPPGYDMSVIDEGSSLNNNGLPLFSGIPASGFRELRTGVRPTFNSVVDGDVPANGPLMIADNGNALFRGFTVSSPIKLYSNNLATLVNIATVSPTTFSALGKSPGISDNGAVVFFMVIYQLTAQPHFKRQQALEFLLVMMKVEGFAVLSG